MTKDKALPPRVFPHGRWYRIAVAKGSRREWTNLSLIADGLRLLGVDCPSVDTRESQTLEVHRILFDGGANVLENLDLRAIRPGPEIIQERTWRKSPQAWSRICARRPTRP